MDNSGIHLRIAPGSAAPAQAAPNGKALPADGQVLPPAAPPPTDDQVRQAVQHIQDYLRDSRRELQIQVDDGTGRTIVRVVNAETHELIRQIPSEEVLTFAHALATNGGRLISDLA